METKQEQRIGRSVWCRTWNQAYALGGRLAAIHTGYSIWPSPRAGCLLNYWTRGTAEAHAAERCITPAHRAAIARHDRQEMARLVG